MRPELQAKDGASGSHESPTSKVGDFNRRSSARRRILQRRNASKARPKEEAGRSTQSQRARHFAERRADGENEVEQERQKCDFGRKLRFGHRQEEEGKAAEEQPRG